MILKRNNHRQILKLTLGAILLCFFFAALSIHPTSAASTKIKVKDITKVASFKSERGGIQGGTITAKYYIFADKDPGNWGKTTIRFFNRGNKKEVKANKNLIAQEFKHASTIYYKWGGAYAEIIDANTGNWWCVDVNARKRVGQSKCGSKLSSSGLNHGKIQYWRQGWTKYGDYYFRAYAGLGNNIEVYNKNRKFVKNYVVPSVGCNEIEDVSVDGSSGDVYIMCHNKTGGHYATYYKINGSVFGNYVSASSGGSSEERTNSESIVKNKESTSSTGTYTPSVSTYDGVVSTIFFGTIQDDGEGCGVYTVLDLVMTILTIGIGIAALIGISISGIIYLTAGGSVEKTTKAKRRIYEIVIGLAAYVAIFAVLTFLLPEFNPELKACKTLTAEEITARDAETAAKKQANQQTNQQSSPSSNPNLNAECMKKALPKIRDSICQLDTASERIARTAELLAIPYGKKNSQNRFTKPKKWSQINGAKPPTYFQNAYDKYRKGHWKLYSKKYGNVTRVGASCDVFVATVLKSTGYANPSGYTHGAIRSKLKKKNKWKIVKKAKRGDVCQNGDKHIRIYLGNGKVAEAQSGAKSGVSRFGHIANGGCSGYTIYRAIK